MSVILIIALLVGIVTAGWAMGTLIARYSASTKNLDTADLSYSGISSGECYTPKSENIIYDDSENGVGYVNNMILVFFSNDASQTDIAQVVEDIGGHIVGQIEGINQYQIEVEATNKDHLESLCEELQTNAIVKFAVIDYVFSIESSIVSAPNDPWKDTFQGIGGVDWDENNPSGTNWWAEATNILSAWNYSASFTAINVGIVDNGYDTNHEDLSITVINNDVNSFENHGTHVAGVIGATVNNEIGISGILDQVNLFCVDCYATSKQEKSNITVSSLMSGIVSCLDNNCKVINMSSGTKYTKKDETHANASASANVAIQYLIAMLDTYNDFIIVQSAGNGNKAGVGVDALEYNGFFSSITSDAIQQVLDEFNEDGVVLEKEISTQDVLDSFIIVGAIDKKMKAGQYQLSEFSNYGSAITVCAPGVDVFSTLVTGGMDGNYGYLDGTSMAAPIVTGITAMVWSVDPSMSASEVKAIIVETATKQVLSRNKKDTGTYYIVDASAAVEQAVEHLGQENDKPAISNENNEAYNVYISAANKTIESGSWSEHLVMTANMAITDGSAKTKTKVSLASEADVSNYSESDLSKVRVSGSAEMSVMGQTYAWDMEYENGTAHYQYTKPNQTSADMKIDPSFFNFGTMTSDMMSNAKMTGNKITFTVPGEKITEVGIAAVNQMSGVDDLEYGDVDVTVTISDDGKIDNIIMVFHASLEYQGYDADVDYNIDYRFSDSSNTSSKPLSSGVPIVAGIYAQDGSPYNTLTIHETGNQTLEFTAFWYRIGDLSNVEATLENNIASFEFFTPNAKMHVFGTLRSPTENSVILKISESTHEYVEAGEYRYSLVGRKFTNTELKAISDALNVPSDLDTQITQGEPAYWEGGGIYRTPIEVYYNGELIAGASVNSLTGELAGNIYVYSMPGTSGNDVDLASTFGFNKSWDIHDRSGTEHFVTSLAFSEDGTFYCAVGWYLSEWYTAFTGTYQVNGDEIILNYMLDGDAKMSSYQVKWEDQILRQTSEENLVIAHQIGSEYPFEENPWYTAEQLKDQVDTFMRYNG